MKESYSFTKGIGKGVIAILTFASAGVVFMGLGDVQLWDLIVQYIKPVVGTTTLVGVFAFAVNFAKYNWL